MEDLTKRAAKVQKLKEQLEIINDYQYQNQIGYWVDKCQKARSFLHEDISTFYGNLRSCQKLGFKVDLDNLKQNQFGFHRVFFNGRFHDFIGFEYSQYNHDYYVGINDEGRLRAFYNDKTKYVMTELNDLPMNALIEMADFLENLPKFLNYEQHRMNEFLDEQQEYAQTKLKEYHFILCPDRENNDEDKACSDEHEEYGD